MAIYDKNVGTEVVDCSRFARLRTSLSSESRHGDQVTGRAQYVNINGTTVAITEVDATEKTERKKGGIRRIIGEWWSTLMKRFEKGERL